MPDTYTELDQVEWREVPILGSAETGYDYHFQLPRPLADWDVFDYWERERVYHMRAHLNRGDVLFDVGAEHGWCSLIYASMVGPENMVLIEPTPEFWPNICHTWRRNHTYAQQVPRAFYDGLLSDQTTDGRQVFTGWPDAADGPLIGANKYQYIHENSRGIPEMTLDDFVDRSSIVPDALTIDVEGAELHVLKGAKRTLEEHHPQIWVSIHPDLMARDYCADPSDVCGYLGDLGYTGTHLATDHEQHWYFG